MKYDNIKIVQNFSTAPLNPSFEDCYHNTTNNKYYIYDGIEWLEAKLQNTNYYTLKYKKSNENIYTVEEFSDYESLLKRLRSEDATLAEQEDGIIREGPAEITYKAILQPRIENSLEEEYPLLKLAVQNDTDGQGDIVGKIMPKTYVNQILIENVFANEDPKEVINFNKITVFKKQPGIDIQILSNSAPQNGKIFQVGEQITYQIKIQNIGTCSLKNIIVTNNKNNTEGDYDSMNIGEIKNIQAVYTITQEDLNNKEIYYEIIVQAEDSLLNSYEGRGHLGLQTLTFRFLSDLEEDLQEPYIQQLFEGQSYSIEVPTFSHFIYEEEEYTGTAPGYNQEIKIIYSEKTYGDLTYTLQNGSEISKRFYNYEDLVKELDQTDGTVITINIREGVLE